MNNFRPFSDLRNKLTEIEDTILREGEPVKLTKNGGTMVVKCPEQYAEMNDEAELKLDEAEIAAAVNDKRYTAEEVFTRVRKRLHG